MTTIIEYQCDICRKRYGSEMDAEHCESRGYFDPSQFPVGILFPNFHGNDFVGILFPNFHGAEHCESRGYFDPSQFPVGILFPNFHGNDFVGILFPNFHGNDFVGIFALANVSKYASDPHIGQTNYLAFRAPKFAGGSDSTFENGLCGHDFFSENGGTNGQTAFEKFFGIKTDHWRGNWMKPEDFERPEFMRACRYLVEHNIKPRYVTKEGETVDVLLTAEMIPDSHIVVDIPGGKYAIPHTCPGCGNDIRPHVFRGRIFDGSIRIDCDQWNCPCGHVAKYEEIRRANFRVHND